MQARFVVQVQLPAQLARAEQQLLPMLPLLAE
jgi:hypothetical protein